MKTQGINRGDGAGQIGTGSLGTRNLIDPSDLKKSGPKSQPKEPPVDYAVNLSPEAKRNMEMRAKALEIARNTPDIREDKVADIKAAIANGTYKVDPGKVADGMLREAIKDKIASDHLELDL